MSIYVCVCVYIYILYYQSISIIINLYRIPFGMELCGTCPHSCLSRCFHAFLGASCVHSASLGSVSHSKSYALVSCSDPDMTFFSYSFHLDNNARWSAEPSHGHVFILTWLYQLFLSQILVFPEMWVSPNHPLIDGFSIINQPFGGTSIPGNPHIEML